MDCNDQNPPVPDTGSNPPGHNENSDPVDQNPGPNDQTTDPTDKSEHETNDPEQKPENLTVNPPDTDAESVSARPDCPDQFICPITMRIMREPVTASDGRTYERNAIAQWIEQRANSPYTRQYMGHNDYQLNPELRGEIQGWLRRTGQYQRFVDRPEDDFEISATRSPSGPPTDNESTSGLFSPRKKIESFNTFTMIDSTNVCLEVQPDIDTPASYFYRLSRKKHLMRQSQVTISHRGRNLDLTDTRTKLRDLQVTRNSQFTVHIRCRGG